MGGFALVVEILLPGLRVSGDADHLLTALLAENLSSQQIVLLSFEGARCPLVLSHPHLSLVKGFLVDNRRDTVWVTDIMITKQAIVSRILKDLLNGIVVKQLPVGFDDSFLLELSCHSTHGKPVFIEHTKDLSYKDRFLFDDGISSVIVFVSVSPSPTHVLSVLGIDLQTTVDLLRKIFGIDLAHGIQDRFHNDSARVIGDMFVDGNKLYFVVSQDSLVLHGIQSVSGKRSYFHTKTTSKPWL